MSYGTVHLFVLADIGLQEACGTPIFHDGVGYRLAVPGGPSHDEHLGAGLRKSAGDAFANALTRARNERDLAFEITDHDVLLLRRRSPAHRRSRVSLTGHPCNACVAPHRNSPRVRRAAG